MLSSLPLHRIVKLLTFRCLAHTLLQVELLKLLVIGSSTVRHELLYQFQM